MKGKRGQCNCTLYALALVQCKRIKLMHIDGIHSIGGNFTEQATRSLVLPRATVHVGGTRDSRVREADRADGSLTPDGVQGNANKSGKRVKKIPQLEQACLALPVKDRRRLGLSKREVPQASKQGSFRTRLLAN
jgi:hypothetical protein